MADFAHGVGIAAVPGGSPANVIARPSIPAVPVPLDEDEDPRYSYLYWSIYLCRWMSKLTPYADDLLYKDLPGCAQLHVPGTHVC